MHINVGIHFSIIALPSEAIVHASTTAVVVLPSEAIVRLRHSSIAVAAG